MTKLERLKNFLLRTYYLDSRSVSLSRVILGIANFGYIIQILLDHNILLGEKCFIPTRDISEIPLFGRLYFLDKSYWFHLFLIASNIVCIFLFIFSKHKRIFSLALSVFALATLQWINPLVNSGFKLLYFLYFYHSLIIIKETRNGTTENAQFSFGGFALYVQVCLIFLNSVIFKIQNSWWLNGDALYQAFQLDAYTTTISRSMRFLPREIFTAGTYFTMTIETLAPLALLLFGFNEKIRLFSLIQMTILIIGFFIFLDIGFFPLVFLGGIAALYPSTLWDRTKIFRSNNNETSNFSTVGNLTLGNSIISMAVILAVTNANLISAFPHKFSLSPLLNKFIYEPLLLNQNWGVYCQNKWITKSLVMEARTREGFPGDLWRWWVEGEKEDPVWIFYPSPYYVRNTFRSSLWRDYVYYLSNDETNQSRLNLTKSLCRMYNNSHDEKIVSVKILTAQRETLGFSQFSFAPARTIATIECE